MTGTKGHLFPPALKMVIKDVTNEKSDHFIPVEDRVAVFDMDGTLCGELFPTYIEYLLLEYRVLDDDTYTGTDEDTIATANLIRETGRGSFPSDMALRHAYAQAKAFEGMEINEFQNYVKNFLKRNAAGFNNLTYAKSFYLPMLEVLTFLQSNSFITYIVSGSDRYICRAAACEITNVPANQVIGMDVKLEATNQGETDGLDYQFKDNDKVLRTDELLIKNLKMNKVFQIAQEIGKQPILAFGNSSGDLSMELYTITNNKYKSLAFMFAYGDAVAQGVKGCFKFLV